MGLRQLFANHTHLINAASSNARTMDIKILEEEEILFLNILWSFCEDEDTNRHLTRIWFKTNKLLLERAV